MTPPLTTTQQLPKATIHLYLVSAQATPNITPALDEATRPKQVVLLVSPDMKKQAQWLSSVLKNAVGMTVLFWDIDHPWDIHHIRERVLELMVRYEDESIALNVTGGTKLMSIGAYDVFRAENKPIFYVHPERDALVWLHSKQYADHPLANRVKIPHFIEAYGGQVVSQGMPSVKPAYREFAAHLIQRIETYSNALGTLNFYANKADKKSLTSPSLDKSALHNAAFRDLLGELSDLDMVSIRAQRLVFTSEAARFFANGGWLEQYVFATLNSLKKELPSIQDTAASVEVVRGNGVKNELDVACLVDNRLQIIECKAKNFSSNKAAGSGTETLYKLDSLADTIGGLKARALLVSYRPLNEHDQRRAKDLRVMVLQAHALQNLREHLKKWIVQGGQR